MKLSITPAQKMPAEVTSVARGQLGSELPHAKVNLAPVSPGVSQKLNLGSVLGVFDVLFLFCCIL